MHIFFLFFLFFLLFFYNYNKIIKIYFSKPFRYFLNFFNVIIAMIIFIKCVINLAPCSLMGCSKKKKRMGQTEEEEEEEGLLLAVLASIMATIEIIN